MCPDLHHERGQFIQPCLFNPINNNKIHFLLCNDTSKPPVLFMHSHHVPLIFIYFSKNTKNKAIRKHKLPSHLTNNLRRKKPCGQSSIKAFYKDLPGKKGKLNMITSAVANKYAFMRSFGFSSIVDLSSCFFWQNSKC